jgi:hypothetical protein
VFIIKLGKALDTQEFVKNERGTVTLRFKKKRGEPKSIVSEFSIVQTGKKHIIVVPTIGLKKRRSMDGNTEIVRADIGSAVIIF